MSRVSSLALYEKIIVYSKSNRLYKVLTFHIKMIVSDRRVNMHIFDCLISLMMPINNENNIIT